MAGRSSGTHSLLFIVAQTLWVLVAVQPASAQVVLPPNFISPDVPHDVPTGASASIQDLAIFAWREFIALNWVAMDPATTGVRGRPNGDDPNAGFLSIQRDPATGSFPLLVWHTYRHKNELFPASGQTDPNFNSKAPTYIYDPAPTTNTGANFQLFNNLDETSEIGVCTMFAHNTTRIIYEAKVSRAVFDYANKNQLTKSVNPGAVNPPVGVKIYPQLSAATKKTKDNLGENGGICSSDPSIVSLPCGDNAVSGDPGEGAIEIKAAWRELTVAEANAQPPRFLTQNIIYYTGPQNQQVVNNAIYGLVALHIIHKTKSFPAFVFASWEQVDNYADGNPEALAFNNLPPDPLPNSPPVQLTRNHPIHSQIPPVNDAVHAAFTAKYPSTIWQYYKLIGVQATPVNGPPSDTSPPDDLSYYYLANIVVETNQTLQNFFGSLPVNRAVPKQNVYIKGAAGSPFQMGGCQGCHGAAGQSNGGDMSVLIGFGPSNATSPESIDDNAATAVESYAVRSRRLTRQ
jgi:hypothetical protein